MGDRWGQGSGAGVRGAFGVSEMIIRFGLVLVIVLAAAGVAFIISRVKRPGHPNINVGDAGDRPGVVIFTSTECGTCKQAIARLRDSSIPFREITNELEAQRFEDWDVVAVPLTAVIDSEGAVTRTFSGVPSTRRLVKAVTAVGIERR
jgi:hypothetical protein